MTERAEVEISSQTRVSTRLEVSSVQEEKMEMQQPGSPSVLMPTSRVVEPSPATGVLYGKSPVTEVSLVQVSSSSSEEYVDYSGDEVDFGDEPAPSDISKFHTSPRRRCRWMSLHWFRHREKLLPPRVFLLPHLFFSSYEHCLDARLTVICRSCHRCQSCNLLSH